MTKPSSSGSAFNAQENKAQSNLNPKAAARIKALRKQRDSTAELLAKIIAGNKTALSQGITLIESEQAAHSKAVAELIEGCLPHANRSIRIGITGVPGVGKSTFIDTFGSLLIRQGKKVAVLAVDPSSSISHGSILGDKTRMATLSKVSNAYIRPTASGDSLGGVAKKTRESIILCEAAGFDTILIETVGVGQSETLVHSMTDFFLLLKLAGAGDELQGIKRGIMEMADAIVINKADGENKKAARQAKSEFRKALHFYPLKNSQWEPEVKLCSALKETGIAPIWKMIATYWEQTLENNFFTKNRHEQNKFWLLQTINSRLKAEFYQNPTIKSALQEQLTAIENNKTSPFEAAELLLKLRD